MNSQNIIYVGPYVFVEEDSLWTQLAMKLTGVGLINSLCLLQTIGVKGKDLRTISYKELSETQKDLLRDALEKSVVSLDSYAANRKASNLSKTYQNQVFFEDNSLIIGDHVKSQYNLDQKRLGSMRCYVGLRLRESRKVHGQRTKSTGRKNKILKGFQKRKLNK